MYLQAEEGNIEYKASNVIINVVGDVALNVQQGLCFNGVRQYRETEASLRSREGLGTETRQ